MKVVLFIISLLLIFALGTGCRTVPRHLAQEKVVVYYYDYPVTDPPIYIVDPPVTEPPVVHPFVSNPVPTRDPQPKTPGDGGSYGHRDPLQGGGKRPPAEIKTYPPVKKPAQNDRVQ